MPPERPRVVFEDPSLPHQIVIMMRPGFKVGVSCNCLRVTAGGRRGSFEPLEVRSCFPAAEAIAVWRKHLEASDAA